MAKKWILGAAAAAVATAALATVTFDPATGTGFVGKGDVQLAFGWNNATLQQQAGNVTFSYTKVESTDYSVTCEFDTGTNHVVHHVQTTQHSLSDTVAYDVTKKNRQNPNGDVTGFNLNGWASAPTITQDGDPIPQVGDGCPGNSGLGAVTAVTVNADTSTSVETLSVSDTALGLGPVALNWPATI